MTPTVEQLRDGVIETVVENFDYFREHPKHLAWAMMNFSLVHYAGRMIDPYTENPKDIVIDAGYKLPNKGDSDLIYDAWGVSVSNQRAFPDTNPKLPLESKSNKTLDEWIELCTDRNYEFRSLFPNEFRVKDRLLCSIGTGMGWNKDGFITHTGPSDVDESIFANYTGAENEIRPDLKEQILKIRSNPLIINHVNDYLKDVEINAGDNRAEKRIVNESWKVKQDIKKLPKKEQNKIMKAFRQVAYLEAIVDDAKYWTEEEWKEARKSNIYNYQGTDFDISEIDLSFCHTTMGFGSDITFSLERGEKIEDYRKGAIINNKESKWREFVYEIENLNNPKVRKANAIVMNNISSELYEMLELKGKPPTKETDEKIKKARDYLNTQRPNLEKYKPILEKAEKGCEKAAALLDKKAEVPLKGWDSIKYFALDEQRELSESLARLSGKKSEKKEKRTHYPICEYSNMITMPENAHESYVKASIEIAKEIIENPEERESAREYAVKFLEKWGDYKNEKC